MLAMKKSGATLLILCAVTGAAFGQIPPPFPPLTNASTEEPVTVAEVFVQGSEKVSTPTILSYVRTRPGTNYSSQTVQDDARALAASKLLADVRIQVQNLPDGRVNVYFVVRDLRSEILKIDYQGAKHLKDDELNAITGLHTGAPLNPTQNKLACQKIVRKYNDMGRPFADCSLLKGDQASDREVVFQITEGPRVQIDELRFTGNSFVSAAVLATHIRSAAKTLGLGGDYNPELIEDDISKLQEYYRSFGYFDVAISSEVQLRPDGCNAVLIFHVREGVRYRLKEIPHVFGSKKTPRPEELGDVLKVKVGEYYDGRKLKRGEDEIRDWYGFQGYEVRVQAVPYFVKEQPGVVAVRFEVEDNRGTSR